MWVKVVIVSKLFENSYISCLFVKSIKFQGCLFIFRECRTEFFKTNVVIDEKEILVFRRTFL